MTGTIFLQIVCMMIFGLSSIWFFGNRGLKKNLVSVFRSVSLSLRWQGTWDSTTSISKEIEQPRDAMHRGVFFYNSGSFDFISLHSSQFDKLLDPIGTYLLPSGQLSGTSVEKPHNGSPE